MTWLPNYTAKEVLSMTILHLDSSILGPGSVSRSLSAAVVEHLRNSHPEADLVYRDLAQTPIPHLSGSYLAAGQNPEEPHDPAVAEDLALGQAALEEFLQADTVVLGVAFYNFTISSQLKAWIDRIAVAGKTFRYGANGAEGLCGDKRVVLAISRGGFYGPGTATESFEHAETYLKSVLAFLGVKNVEVVSAEGVALGPEQREQSLRQALEKIALLRAA